MRTIKFRGKGVDDKWHYGLLAYSYKDTLPEGYYISNEAYRPFAYLVFPKTIGQFTGLYDKNGNEIWEGDIVKVPGCIDRGDGFFDDDLCEIKWNNDYGYYYMEGYMKRDISGYCELEIISNIHDNPELLKS